MLHAPATVRKVNTLELGARPAGEAVRGDDLRAVTSPRARLDARIVAWSVVVGLSTLFDLAVFVGWVGNGVTAGEDGTRLLRAAQSLAAHAPLYSDPAFLYSPLAALLAWPASLLPTETALAAWLVAELALTGLLALRFTRGLPFSVRLVAVVGATTSLPVLYDVALGNTTVVLLATMALVVMLPDGVGAGLALGVMAAAIPKPLVVPFLAWMLVWRRRALAGTLLAGAAATAVAMLVAGAGAYQSWIAAARAGTRFAVPFAGNSGLTELAPAAALPIMLVTAALFVWVLARRDQQTALVWALGCGLIVAPYVGLYGAAALLLAIPELYARAPRLTFGLAAIAPLAAPFALPLLGGAAMAVALVTRPASAAGHPGRVVVPPRPRR